MSISSSFAIASAASAASAATVAAAAAAAYVTTFAVHCSGCRSLQ